MSTPVPAEYLGLARDLRRRLAVADAAVHTGIKAAVMPLWTRLDRHPVLRRDKLLDARRTWQTAVPPFGRLNFTADIADRRAPRFQETRAASGLYRNQDWTGGYEPGVMLLLLSAGIDAGTIVITPHTLASVSLHGLARRYQRGTRAEATIFRDLAALAAMRTGDLLANGAFVCTTPGGHWHGHVVLDQAGKRALAVRTFLDADARAAAA